MEEKYKKIVKRAHHKFLEILRKNFNTSQGAIPLDVSTSLGSEITNIFEDDDNDDEISAKSSSEDDCSEESMIKQTEVWKSLLLKERGLYDKRLQLLFRTHHPLKMEENAAGQAVILTKKHELETQLVQCLEQQYKIFRRIKHCLEYCYDTENMDIIKNNSQHLTGEQIYKRHQYDLLMKRWKELLDSKAGTWGEDIKIYEKKLNEYLPKSVGDKEKPLTDDTQVNLENTVKHMSSIGKPVDAIVDELLKINKIKLKREKRSCKKQSAYCRKIHDENRPKNKKECNKMNELKSVIGNRLEDFLKIPIPEVPKNGEGNYNCCCDALNNT